MSAGSILVGELKTQSCTVNNSEGNPNFGQEGGMSEYYKDEFLKVWQRMVATDKVSILREIIDKRKAQTMVVQLEDKQNAALTVLDQVTADGESNQSNPRYNSTKSITDLCNCLARSMKGFKPSTGSGTPYGAGFSTLDAKGNLPHVIDLGHCTDTCSNGELKKLRRALTAARQVLGESLTAVIVDPIVLSPQTIAMLHDIVGQWPKWSVKVIGSIGDCMQWDQVVGAGRLEDITKARQELVVIRVRDVGELTAMRNSVLATWKPRTPNYFKWSTYLLVSSSDDCPDHDQEQCFMKVQELPKNL